MYFCGLPSGNNCAVVLPVKGCRTKVNQLNPGVSHPSDWLLALGTRSWRLQIPIIGDKEDIFRFEVSVGDFVVMHKGHSTRELIGDVSYLKTLIKACKSSL